MNEKVRTTRCGFIVIRVRVDSEDYVLMRRNPDWQDVNFIGGHEKDRDRGNLETTVRRELLEEVPVLRTFRSFEIAPITDLVTYGPVHSRSANRQTEYVLQFFRLKFLSPPIPLIESLGAKSNNRFVRLTHMISKQRPRVSNLACTLHEMLDSGLQAIPLSWPDDLGPALRKSGVSWNHQLELPID